MTEQQVCPALCGSPIGTANKRRSSAGPGDAKAMAEHLDQEATPDWMAEHLRESHVGYARTRSGRSEEVWTISPAQREDGSCVFLDGDRCTVHPVAPVGCALHDMHRSDEVAHRISTYIALDALTDDEYARQASALRAAGKIARPARERQQALAEAELAERQRIVERIET